MELAGAAPADSARQAADLVRALIPDGIEVEAQGRHVSVAWTAGDAPDFVLEFDDAGKLTLHTGGTSDVTDPLTALTAVRGHYGG